MAATAVQARAGALKILEGVTEAKVKHERLEQETGGAAQKASPGRCRRIVAHSCWPPLGPAPPPTLQSHQLPHRSNHQATAAHQEAQRQLASLQQVSADSSRAARPRMLVYRVASTYHAHAVHVPGGC